MLGVSFGFVSGLWGLELLGFLCCGFYLVGCSVGVFLCCVFFVGLVVGVGCLFKDLMIRGGVENPGRKQSQMVND